MKTIGVSRARKHFSKWLSLVEKGEHFTITRYGIPVARLIPPDNISKITLTPKEAVAELKELRKSCTLGELSIRSMIDEGKRY